MKTKPASKEMIIEMIELSKTKSQKEIAEIYNWTQSGIHRILKRNNVKLKNSRLNMSHLALNINYFKEIDSQDKAYWLGYICADGNIAKNNNKITLFSKDLEVIENFKKAIGAEHAISKRDSLDKRTNKIYTGYSIQIGNELFVANLINLGVTSNKTDVLNFPNIEEKYYSYFIAGLFDGDGSVGFRNHGKLRVSLISTKEVLDFICRLLITMGINELSRAKVSINKKNVWKMYLYKDTNQFLNYIYGDKNFKYYLMRKYNIFKNGSRT